MMVELDASLHHLPLMAKRREEPLKPGLCLPPPVQPSSSSHFQSSPLSLILACVKAWVNEHAYNGEKGYLVAEI